MNRHIKYALMTILLLIIQTAGMRLVTIEGITPDILALWIIVIALNEGQMPATMWGFSIGLVFDLISGNFLGLSALTKTVCGFIAGYFYNENKTRLSIGSYRFLLIVLVTCFIQNLVYFFIYTRGSDISVLSAVFRYGTTTALYTAAFSLFLVFIYSRRSPLEHV